MKLSERGLDLIIGFEGFCATAKKCVKSEKYLTIGYGHYGADVKEGATITKKDARTLLKSDIAKFEKKVDKYNSIYGFNQNEYDALVSFAYNVGSIDKLTVKGRRTRAEIAAAMLKYVNSGGKKMPGLVRRRTKERELFLTPVECEYYKRYVGSSNNIDAVLKWVGVPSKYVGAWRARKPLAEKNGITNYVGSMHDNVTLINLAKNGILKRI